MWRRPTVSDVQWQRLHAVLLASGGVANNTARARIATSTLGDVTVILGERRLQLTSVEAQQLHDQLVERNLAVLALQSDLSRAIQADVGQHEIPADDEIRQELLLCLDAIEDEVRLTEGLQNLRQAARVPITPRPEY